MWCFSWFRKLPMDPNWCFLMPWWSRDHPRLILDRFEKLHFSSKFSLFFWLNMTLRADRLKSNYLGCWIFEISSAPDLDPFSILFFVFLNICSVEFDKFHLVFAFWVAWGLGTLRLTRLWIYIWVFVKVGVKISVKKMKIFMKKWSFPNPSRINLGWSLDHQGMKKHQFGSIGSFRNHEKTSKFWKKW